MTEEWVDLWVDEYAAEDGVLVEARARSAERGVRPITPATGAALRFLAAAVRACGVVEIGTGTGVSGLWLLRGMAPDGTLTSIDVDPEHQRLARAAFVADGNGPSRLRLINGLGQEVLPRLTDGGYDLVFVDAAAADQPRYLEEALRLLRVGGIVAVNGVFTDGGPGDARTGVPTREVTRHVAEDDRLAPVLLPTGDGLLAAVKRSS